MLRLISALLLVGLVVGLLPQSTRAQSFSFSIGSYPGCYHRHHHCWQGGYWYGAPYGPPYVDYLYVYPRPQVTYVQPTVVQPAVVQPYVARVEPTPAAVASTASTSRPVQPAAAETLQIWNSSGQRVPVSFLANSQSVALADGQSHTFYGGGTRIVEFDRGGAFGTARYELTGGEHEFIVTGRGWDLVPRSERTSPIALKPIPPKNSLPSDTAAR